MFISTRELPSCVQRLLKRHGYFRPDIAVMPKEQVSISDAGATGQKAYAIIVNLETQQAQTLFGSWGGSNCFNPNNRVDLDTKSYEIPLNGLVIKGSEGYRSFAKIYVHPDNLAKYLPATESITEDEREILNAYYGLKPGPYRRQALERVANRDNLIGGLVGRGLLKQAKNGATQITTEGKNALRKAA